MLDLRDAAPLLRLFMKQKLSNILGCVDVSVGCICQA